MPYKSEFRKNKNKNFPNDNIILGDNLSKKLKIKNYYYIM